MVEICPMRWYEWSMRIKYVNGFNIRNTIDVNFGGHYTRDYAAYIPPDEIWVEDYLKPEISLILKIVKTEKKFFSKNKSFKKLRDFLKRGAKKNGSPPPFYRRITKKGKIKVVDVDGAVVRKFIDPYFISGGHDLVYEYIPRNEIWIDALNYKEDQPFVLVHEIFERNLMAQGRDYASAHDFAIAEEKHRRRQAGVAKFITG